MATPTRIPFPLGGLHEGLGYDVQPEGTTHDLLNVRAHDALANRLRGGRRPGLSKFHATTIAGTSSIQEIVAVPRASETPAPGTRLAVAGGDANSGSNRYSKVIGTDGVVVMEYDTGAQTQGVVLGVDDTMYIVGKRSTTWEGTDGSTQNVWAVDDEGNVLWTYLGPGDVLAADGDPGAIVLDEANNRVIVAGFRSNDWTGNDGGNRNVWALNATTGALIWAIATPAADPSTIFGVAVDSNGDVYVCGTAVGGGGDTRSLWKLDGSDGSAITDFKIGVTAHDVRVSADDQVLVGCRLSTDGYTGATPTITHNVFRFDTDLALVEAFEQGEQTGSGPGVQVEFGDDGDYYIGHEGGVVKFSTADVTEWSFSTGAGSDAWVGIARLDDGRLAVCADRDDDWTGSGGADASFWILTDATGAVEASVDLSFAIEAASGGACYGMTASSVPEGETTTRETSLVICTGGKLRKWKDGSVSLPTSGSGVQLLPHLFQVQGTAAFGNAYFVDGTNAKVWKFSDDSVADWSGEVTDGVLPTGARLITLYRGRVVLAGAVADPHNWHMSKVGDPNDWDVSPTPVTVIQAVSGNNSEVGLVGDVITALAPFSDDAMLFGGDHTIWQMSGDPAAGGSIDLVSDKTGMAWDAWTQDPKGRIYFVGTDGVYSILPNEKPVSLTEGRLDERFKAVDLSTTRILMAWDYLRHGLVVVLGKLGQQTQTTYFWDERADAWFEEEYPAMFGPSVVYAFDLEKADDQALLLGSKDGYLRQLDDDEDTDDGTGIPCRVRMTMVNMGDNVRSGKTVSTLPILAEDSGDVVMRIYAGQTAEECANSQTIRAARTVSAGRNPVVRRRVRGAWLQYELAQTGATTDTRWALESLTAGLEPSGLPRRRSR